MGNPGEWEEWGPWTDCTRTCGSATRSRERYCEAVFPELGEGVCSGHADQTETCTGLDTCPPGNLAPWAFHFLYMVHALLNITEKYYLQKHYAIRTMFLEQLDITNIYWWPWVTFSGWWLEWLAAPHSLQRLLWQWHPDLGQILYCTDTHWRRGWLCGPQHHSGPLFRISMSQSVQSPCFLYIKVPWYVNIHISSITSYWHIVLN